MKYLLYNHSWEDYKKTLQFLGFSTEQERKLVSQGDVVVYFGNGLVVGIFEVGESVENGFNGWSTKKPFQIAIKPLHIPSIDLIAKPLRYKVQLEAPIKGSQYLYSLSDQEYGKIELAIKEGKKELIY